MKGNSHFFGLDLSGPSNLGDTFIVHMQKGGSSPKFCAVENGLDDVGIVDWISSRANDRPFTIAIDAPLSYQPGGGLRKSDRSLREFVKMKGYNAGIMPPTLTKMVYITLRGINLVRLIQSECPGATIIESHPGVTLQASGVDGDLIMKMKSQSKARNAIVDYLSTRIVDLIPEIGMTDHGLAACGCAMAAEAFERGANYWFYDASPPQHPCIFAC